MRQHLGQTIGAEEEPIAGAQLHAVRLGLHTGLGAADDVGDDVAQAMMPRLGEIELAAADHLGDHRVVAGDLIQRPVAKDVGAAVADMNHEQLRFVEIGERQRRPHAVQVVACAGRFDDCRVHLLDRFLEVAGHALGVGSGERHEPPERIQRELFDQVDGQRAGVLAGPVPAHAIGDQEEMAALFAESRARLFEAGLPDLHRLGQIGDQELIFVGRSDASPVGGAMAANGQRYGTGVAGHRRSGFSHCSLIETWQRLDARCAGQSTPG